MHDSAGSTGQAGDGSDLNELRTVFQDEKLAGVFARDLQVCRRLMAPGIGE